jgi:hypothetical protein
MQKGTKITIRTPFILACRRKSQASAHQTIKHNRGFNMHERHLNSHRLIPSQPTLPTYFSFSFPLLVIIIRTYQ